MGIASGFSETIDELGKAALELCAHLSWDELPNSVYDLFREQANSDYGDAVAEIGHELGMVYGFERPERGKITFSENPDAWSCSVETVACSSLERDYMSPESMNAYDALCAFLETHNIDDVRIPVIPSGGFYEWINSDVAEELLVTGIMAGELREPVMALSDALEEQTQSQMVGQLEYLRGDEPAGDLWDNMGTEVFADMAGLIADCLIVVDKKYSAMSKKLEEVQKTLAEAQENLDRLFAVSSKSLSLLIAATPDAPQ